MNSEDFYDSIAEQYDTFFQDESSKEEDAKVKEHLLAFDKLAEKRVLDIGCGTGLLLEMVDIDNYVGIDPSKAMLDVFKKKFPTKTALKTEFEDYHWLNNREVLISLYGSISYVDPNYLNEYLTHYHGDFYFMFYNDKYEPVTYDMAGNKAEHNNLFTYKFIDKWLKDANVYFLGNYVIFTSLDLK